MKDLDNYNDALGLGVMLIMAMFPLASFILMVLKIVGITAISWLVVFSPLIGYFLFTTIIVFVFMVYEFHRGVFCIFKNRSKE